MRLLLSTAATATAALVASACASSSARSAGGAAAPATPAPAAPSYRRAAGDTVRLRELSISESTIRTPQGDIPVSLRHDAVIALVFLPGDSARAWYDTLTLEATTPQGTQRPPTGAALRQPFTLRFDSRGRVETLATPAFPESFRGITDLRFQFDDFFLRLPSAPLVAGLAWADTVSRRDSTAERWMRSSRTVQYRVEGDTTVDGARGLVVSMRQQVRINAGGPVPGQPITAESAMTGADSGVFVFSPATGRILGRRRGGELSGPLTLHTGQGPMALQQSIRYTNTLTPVGR